MPSKTFLYLFFIVIIIVLVWFGISKRKDLPRIEALPFSNGCVVINPGKWFNNTLKISLLLGRNKIEEKGFDDTGVSHFNGLVNGSEYSIEIKRTDLKGMILYKKEKIRIVPRKEGSKYLVLVGASIGNNWKIQQIDSRVAMPGNFVLGSRTIYDFDKGLEIDNLARMSVPVYGVIIKECSAYFPRDIERSKEQIGEWTSRLSEKKIIPILATVVPITRERDSRSPGKFNSIIEYNDYIREYSKDNRILILDLEKELRISDQDRHLKDVYAQPDGSHLVERAYHEVLDKYFLSFLKNNFLK